MVSTGGGERPAARLPGLDVRSAAAGLRLWGVRRWAAAVLFAGGVAILIGVATVLIPNPLFARDIPPVWWNYPVWLLTAALSGMLAATYVRAAPAGEDEKEQAAPAEARSSRWGLAGTVLAWFAVGCPVCNKIALIALGYSGALTFFAPFQPVLAVAALVLTGAALVWRLQGQVACPLPSAAPTAKEA